MSASGMTTEGLTPAQLEIGGSIQFAKDKMQLLPWFVGIWLDTVLCGLFVALFFHWLRTAGKTDRPWVKVMMWYILSIHLILTGVLLAWQTTMFVTGFGQYRYFLNTAWTRATYAITSFGRFPCSVFFTHRAWLMYRKHWAIPAVIGPVIAAAMGCGLAVAATYKYFPQRDTPRLLVWNMMLLEIIIDLTLTILLAVALVRRKSEFKQTNRLIKRVLWLTFETQIPPTIMSAVFLAVTVKWGNTTQSAWFIAKPKLYPICLLVVLISRQHFDRQQQISSAFVYEGNSIYPQTASAGAGFALSSGQIRVDTTVDTAVAVLDPSYEDIIKRSLKRAPLQQHPSDSDVSTKGLVPA